MSREGDSYKLYARDIVKHHLTARLVTISACEGAGKRAYSGEGLVGLSWAFLRAGALDLGFARHQFLFLALKFQPVCAADYGYILRGVR